MASSGAFAGKVAVVGDEWPLSDYAFDLFPEQANLLATTIANFFAPAGSGEFLVVSNTPPELPFGPRGVTGPALAQAMQSLGHTWTIDPDADLSSANSSQYDALFFSGTLGSGAANVADLRRYVRAGGGVFLMGGTQDFSTAAAEANAWNPFLSEFGLQLGDSWFGGSAGAIAELPVVDAGSPPGQGVDSLAWSVGQLATVVSAGDSRTRVALHGDFTTFGGGPQGAINDVLAVYEAPFLAGDYNDDGRVDAIDYAVWRESLATPIDLPGDATPGVVDATDFETWKTQYGAEAALASFQSPNDGGQLSIVPEPQLAIACLLLFILVAAGRPNPQAASRHSQ